MMNYFSGKNVVVMGLGLHGGGVSVVRWLLQHGAQVTVTDLKTRKQLGPSLRSLESGIKNQELRFVLGEHQAVDFRNADIVVQNPAVPRESPYLEIARKARVQIENEATLFFKYCKSKNIIGVTGTRGKSTTAAMIAHILKKRFTFHASRFRGRVWLAGNIRTTPMLSIVDRVKPNDWVVLELSSWHLENMGEQKISPHVAVVTNVLDDHMNRYQSKHDYARAKENIVRYQQAGDIAILNKKNPWTKKMAHRTKAKVLWLDNYSITQLPNFQDAGAHNLANARAAAAVARAVGVPLRIIRSSLRTFRGLPDRQEIIRVVRGVTYVNDTTATTPDATIAALQRFSNNELRIKNQERCVVLICGGMDKSLNYKPLIPWIKKMCKAVVFLPGTATEKIKKLLNYAAPGRHPAKGGGSITELPITEASSMSAAVSLARTQTSRGDTILLSPAAASFGLFQHEFDRGAQFKKYVPSN